MSIILDMSKSTDLDQSPETFSAEHESGIRYRSGPHGVGDPNDQTLRKVEIEVSIPSIVRERAHREKCHDLVNEFGKCGEKHGVWSFLKCRKEVKGMHECLTTWFRDENFREECTQMYLAQRTEYRATGVMKKPIKRPYYINPQKEMDRIDKMRKEYERLEHKND